MACFKVVPAVNQIETNLYCQRSLERSWMDKKSVAHMAYAPLGQDNRNEMFGGLAVRALAEKYGKTPAQILLRFLMRKFRQEGISCIFITARARACCARRFTTHRPETPYTRQEVQA